MPRFTVHIPGQTICDIDDEIEDDEEDDEIAAKA